MNVHIIKGNKPVIPLVEQWLKEEKGIIVVEIIYVKQTTTIEKDTSSPDSFLSTMLFSEKVIYSATILYLVVED